MNTIVVFGILIGIVAAIIAIAGGVAQIVRDWHTEERRTRQVLTITASAVLVIIVLVGGGTALAVQYNAQQSSKPPFLVEQVATTTSGVLAPTPTSTSRLQPTTPPTATHAPAPTAAPTRRVRTIAVDATTQQPGIDSGLQVKRGARITVAVTGRAQYGFAADCGDVSHPYTDPDGQRYSDLTASTSACPILYEYDAALPSAPIGSLLARIGSTGNWFEIGSHYGDSAPATGELFLIYNDGTGSFADNSGNYSVTLTVQP